jgi:hypothetical protein
MIRFLSISMAFLFPFVLSAQNTVPRLSKFPVAQTGCSVYLPGSPGEFEKSLSQDSSEVYTGEVQHGDHFFAVILVKFTESTASEIQTPEVKAMLMESYLDYLKAQFGITASAGYGRGHTLESAPSAVGVIDFWEDAEKKQYAVKSWCNGQILSVLLLYGPKEYPHFNVQQLFLNGFRFPE